MMLKAEVMFFLDMLPPGLEELEELLSRLEEEKEQDAGLEACRSCGLAFPEGKENNEKIVVDQTSKYGKN